MKSLPRNTLGGALAVMMMVSPAAWAGSKSRTNVSIVFSGSGGSAQGLMGTARSSTDTYQFLGCAASVGGTPGTGTSSAWMTCSARNSSNVTVSCTSGNPAFIEALHSLNSDSYISFSWDGAGTCTALTVGTYSQYETKTL
ncbi:hypothetical protein [Hyalangium versicolor]|uniref:hypothetical protein n=1 Tax=Hyalangium versicolor TaxID=2861190 RepID=UPI001CCC5CDC|nr:hypothetical protein [Hyalangium versicolor]